MRNCHALLGIDDRGLIGTGFVQLFNKKTIARHIAHAPPPDDAKVQKLREWAANIVSKQIHSQKETALAGEFKQKIMVEVLGYAPSSQSGAWTIDVETQIGGGRVDLAIGHFTANEANIIAPFELKGADTKDLDAIMAGRAKSPADQAWEYASNNVGSKWVLLSNYLEIRLYSYADGKQFYESFDLSKLHEADEYHRFMLLLSADNILGGATLDLLSESRKEDKDISAALYSDYKILRSDLIGAVQAAKPDMDGLEAIGIGQTILDRILFIAFAEDNGLLPDDIIASAYESQNAFATVDVWQNFIGLFTAIDKGNEALNIPKYNGGLFKRNPIIREIIIPDHICEGFKRLAEYDFASEISVTVLGHIFEQSIADVEILQAEALGEIAPEKKSTGTSGRRKRDGVVYTPDYVARFIVDQTLGVHCDEIFNDILAQYATKGAKADDDPIKWKSAKAEREAWAEYRKRLTSLRIVDPACGSGVFLIMAFDYLKIKLGQVNSIIAELSGSGMAGDLLDPDSEILTHNLFGVDVNSESVEIAKLSLWIKTARRGKVLDSLDKNLRVGDSLIEDSSFAYREHGFVWKEAFPEIFADHDGAGGGFDIVLGNPPYVRQELLKELKPYLQKRFDVYHGVVDLYAYFFERGLRLLKTGGRMGYISSSTFFKTGSGKPLRDYLRKNAAMESIVDFGDHQIFEGVTTYPAILTMRAEKPDNGHMLQFWTIENLPKDNFADAYHEHAQPYPQKALTDGSWELESPALQALRAKIVSGKNTLKEVYGSPYRGILTGRNDAFVIDRATRDRLIAQDPKSAEILKPWWVGDDTKPWFIMSEDKYLIFTRRGIDIDSYPAIKAHLAEHRESLEPKPKGWKSSEPSEKWQGRKSGSYKWYEIQDSIDYHEKFSQRRIVYGHFSPRPLFSSANLEALSNDKTYIIPTECNTLLGLLHSNVLWLILTGLAPIVRGKFYELRTPYINSLPIPAATDEQKAALGALAEKAQSCAEERYTLQQSITRRIPDLSANPATAKLSNRLKSWWELPDFAAFQKEVKKTLKADIPLKERNEWESWISETRSQINALSAQIQSAEDDINAAVYALFDLTPDEITLLEANI